MNIRSVSACFAGLALAAVSAAAAMNDPTRPPAAFTEAAGGTLRAPPVLQSVIIGKGARAAIIDGERVEVGGRFREARVVRITEEEVVLSEGATTQVLKMYPDVEKKTARAGETGAPKPPPQQRLP
jgi:MSHA biogenesis protein MshK